MSDLDNEIKETGGHKTTVEINQNVFNLINGLRDEKQLIEFYGSGGITLLGNIGKADTRDIEGLPVSGSIIGYRLYISPESKILMERYTEPSMQNSGATVEERKSIYLLELEDSGGKYAISVTPAFLGKYSAGIEEDCKLLTSLDGDLIRDNVIIGLRQEFDTKVLDVGNKICNSTSVGKYYQELLSIEEKLKSSPGDSPLGKPGFNNWMEELDRVLDKSRWDQTIREINNNVPQTTEEFVTIMEQLRPVSVILKAEVAGITSEVIDLRKDYVSQHLEFMIEQGGKIASQLAHSWNRSWNAN